MRVFVVCFDGISKRRSCRKFCFFASVSLVPPLQFRCNVLPFTMKQKKKFISASVGDGGLAEAKSAADLGAWSEAGAGFFPSRTWVPTRSTLGLRGDPSESCRHVCICRLRASSEPPKISLYLAAAAGPHLSTRSLQETSRLAGCPPRPYSL